MQMENMQEFTDYACWERPCDQLSLDMALSTINMVVLSVAEDGAKISEEPAVPKTLPFCGICGIMGHDGTTNPHSCRFCNAKGQLVLDAVVQLAPARREQMWRQMGERGILKGFNPLDVRALWDRITAGAVKRDELYRTQQRDLQGAGQYPSTVPQGNNNSPYAGRGAPHQFGLRGDAAGNPTSRQDPRNSSMVNTPAQNQYTGA
jgi:hypothetical protein